MRTDAGSYPADLVVLGLGMAPEVALAREAGLRLGETGAIEVDRTQRSRSHPEVFAAGDCSQTYSRITGEALHVALGTHANKQGRVAGLGHRRPGGPLRRRPGDGADEGRRPGDRPHRAVHHPGRDGRLRLPHRDDRGRRRGPATTRAPSAITVKLLSDRGSGLLLGAQIVGGPGSGKRIDVFATAIWAGLTAEEFAGSDLSYAPPFSPTYDPVIVAARVASRVEQG